MHGFVSFKIQQVANNPNGTIIHNEAGIYFDFNAPVITNQTVHTVGENFVELLINSVFTHNDSPVAIKAYPNPFSERVTFDIENMEVEISNSYYII